ncbi:hypothetical protein [Methylomagnum sp.]
MKALSIVALALVCSTASAECTRLPNGRVVCGNGNEAGSYNPNTGTVRKSETNSNGVKTYESNTGAEAKTKNGKGVYQSPTGKTCVKGRYSKGCN